MRTKSRAKLKVINAIDNDRVALGELSEKLEVHLMKLAYEGRAAFGGNVSAVGHCLAEIEKNFTQHVGTTERVIYPFAKKHVPKLEGVVSVLHSDHQELGLQISCIHKILRSILSEDINRLIQKRKAVDIHEKGTYLIYLLRHHLYIERESLMNVLLASIHDDELLLLQKKLERVRQRRKIR